MAVGERVAVYSPGPALLAYSTRSEEGIPVSQARDDGGGRDAGFWLSVVGIYNLITEFAGSPGNSWNSVHQLFPRNQAKK